MASSAEVTRSDSVSLALVAGEVSGDMLAARLLAGLRPHLPGARFHGIGGPRMLEQGLVSDVPIETLTVRNLIDVIPRYRELKGIQNRLRDRLLAEKPDAFIGADYPGFNLGLEEQLRAGGIPTVHFVGPQIWAWRGGRIKKIQRAVSHMLVIFPFEEQIYRDAGVPVTYIGHPLAETIPLAPDTAAARVRLGLAPDARVVTIMPGSRMSELRVLTEPFLRAAGLLARRDPGLRFVVPMAGAKQRALFEEIVARHKLGELPLTVVDNDSHTAIAAADTVLAASGTATLEVALFKKPMVIAYKIKWLEWQIMRHMAYQPWIGLPNILAREFLVPELLQDAASPERIADAVWAQLNDTALRERLAARFLDMHHSLLRDSAHASAEAVLRVIGR